MALLQLTLNRDAFEVMRSGEKAEEFRKPSKWMLSRLNKQYDTVKFTNGYGRERPWFIAEVISVHYAESDYTREYSSGLRVSVSAGDVVITLGRVVEKS
jgi:hypothetical protein